MIVANEAGLKQYVNQEQLNVGFSHASTEPGYPPKRPKQLRATVDTWCRMQGLYPPKKYPNANTDACVEWTSAKTASEKTFSTNMIQSTTLAYNPDELIYTDGSRKDVPGMGLVTGSRVYKKLGTAHLSLKVHPYGQGMLNTVNRAELVAILIALRKCRKGMKECIATDSKCSMQKIAKQLGSPAWTMEDCHRPLLAAIASELLLRARDGDETSIIKVKSHIGIHGNEMADRLANEAADECVRGRAFDQDVSKNFTEPFQHMFWLQQKKQVRTEGGTTVTTECVRT